MKKAPLLRRAALKNWRSLKRWIKVQKFIYFPVDFYRDLLFGLPLHYIAFLVKSSVYSISCENSSILQLFFRFCQNFSRMRFLSKLQFYDYCHNFYSKSRGKRLLSTLQFQIRSDIIMETHLNCAIHNVQPLI